MVLERPYFTKNKICFYESFADPKNPVLVLIMGYSGSAGAWPPSFLRRLSRSFRVLTLDNRGTGQSQKPLNVDDYTMEVFAQDVAAGLRHLAPEGAYVLGYSLGGCIALELTHRFPERVKGLCLLATMAGGAQWVRPKPFKAESPITGTGVWGMYLATWQQAMSPEAMSQHENTLRELFQRSRHRLASLVALQGQARAFQKFDGTAYLQAITVPVWIATGDEDRVVPKENSLKLQAAIPGAQFKYFSRCGHAPYVEQPDALAELLEDLARPR